MNKNVKVSVLIPSFNSQDYIEQCVTSVINQTLEDIEIICIDADSEDNTLAILEELSDSDERIRIIKSDKRSYGHQMNLGFSAAAGKYISIVESDDFIDKEMLENLFNLAEKYDSDITKATFYHYYDDDPEPIMKINNAKRLLEDVESTFVIEEHPDFLGGHPSIWSGIYKTSFIRNNNILFLEEPGAAWVDNPFFHETALLAERILYRHVPYYFYRETNMNSSSNNLPDITIPIKRMIECLEVIEKCNCQDVEVIKVIYKRAFGYLSGVFRRDSTGQYTDLLLPYIQEMLLMMDEDIVLQLNRKMQTDYYKYSSPLHMLDKSNSQITISRDDLNLMIKENDYLYSVIEKDAIENSKLKKKNRKLRKKLKVIKNSKSYKLGSFFAKPIRKLKRLFK